MVDGARYAWMFAAMEKAPYPAIPNTGFAANGKLKIAILRLYQINGNAVGEEGCARMAEIATRYPENRTQCAHGKPPCTLNGASGSVGFAIPPFYRAYQPGRLAHCEFYRLTAYRGRHLPSVSILRPIGFNIYYFLAPH